MGCNIMKLKKKRLLTLVQYPYNNMDIQSMQRLTCYDEFPIEHEELKRRMDERVRQIVYLSQHKLKLVYFNRH